MTTPDMIALLSEAPPGEWIALSKDQSKVVGKGKTSEEALAEARKNGEDEPFLIKVPPASALIL